MLPEDKGPLVCQPAQLSGKINDRYMQTIINVISQQDNIYDGEPTISKCSNPAADVNSQECVGDVIITPNDTISAQKRTNASWAAIRGAHKISKKTNQGTKGNTSGIFHRRSYADVATAPT